MTNKEGWVNIGHFLNCNKVKALKVGAEEIAEACVDSLELDVSEDKLTIRRKENAALPPQSEMRKRDAKGLDKSNPKMMLKGKDLPEDRFDDKGNFILSEKDFNDP